MPRINIKIRPRHSIGEASLFFIAIGLLLSGILFALLLLFGSGCSNPRPVFQEIELEPYRPPLPLFNPRKDQVARVDDPISLTETGGPSLWLTWSNQETWVVNVVEYKTNIAEPWKLYGYVTNAYTNTPWMKLDQTNAQCFFRVGTVGLW